MSIKNNLDYSEFKALLGEAKRSSDPIFCRFVFRPLSFPFGWLLYKAGLKANSISLLSIFLTIISSSYLMFGNAQYIFFASLLMMLIALTDCIDGNVARARGETGPGGEWMDALSGYTVYALLPFSLGIHLSSYSSFVQLTKFWIAIGAATSIANLFLRLLYQKFLSAGIDQSSDNAVKGTGSVLSKFSSEMGLVGWMMPAFLVASITNMLEIYLVIYCLFYLVSAILITVVLVRKVI